MDAAFRSKRIAEYSSYSKPVVVLGEWGAFGSAVRTSPDAGKHIKRGAQVILGRCAYRRKSRAATSH